MAVVLEKTNWEKVTCLENCMIDSKHEPLTKGKQYFCKIGKCDMPTVISDDGIEVHFADRTFIEVFGEFERKREMGRG